MRNIIKCFILFFILISSNTLFAQRPYQGEFENHFFGWSPSARMEALGKSFVAIEDDPYSYYTNPGAMGTLEGLNITAGFANPYYILDDASYNFFSVSYKYKDIGVFGISRDYSDLGKISFYPHNSNELVEYTPFNDNYRLTFSRELFEGFYGGVNFNVFGYDFDDGVEPEEDYETGRTFFADLGALKRFNILENDVVKYRIDLGSSIFNFTQSTVNGLVLPVTFRVGGSINIGVDVPLVSWSERMLNILYILEYQDVLNSKAFDGIKAGMELTFFNVISLRGGYFSIKNRVPDLTNAGDYKYKKLTSEFTYGAGINIPFKNFGITKTDIKLKIDLSVMPQPTPASPFYQREDITGDYRVFNFTASVPF